MMVAEMGVAEEDPPPPRREVSRIQRGAVRVCVRVGTLDVIRLN